MVIVTRRRRNPGLPAAAVAVAMAFVAAGCAHLPYVLSQNHDKIVAIDVALQPDVTVDGKSDVVRGPITLVRQFVRASEVHVVSSQVAFVMASTRLQDLNLRSTGYHSGTWNGVAGTALVLDANQHLRRLEERLAEALRPFRLTPAGAEDFIATPDGSEMNEATVAAIESYNAEAGGVNYRPHILVGPAPGDPAQAPAQPGQAVVFRSVTAAIYQLGSLGSTSRVLWTWNGEVGAR
jgi:hypothetical protein